MSPVPLGSHVSSDDLALTTVVYGLIEMLLVVLAYIEFGYLLLRFRTPRCNQQY